MASREVVLCTIPPIDNFLGYKEMKQVFFFSLPGAWHANEIADGPYNQKH